MGGNQPIDLSYDTGSDWLVVESSSCQNCLGNPYNPRFSLGDPQQVSPYYEIRVYGQSELEGYEYSDTVCFNKNRSTCVEDFKFFLVEYQKEDLTPNSDGILGLSRNHPIYTIQDSENTTGPLFTEAAVSAGIISSNKFSFYLKEPNVALKYDSWIDFGEPILAHIK